MTTTGSTKAATSSRTVAMVTDRSMRLPSGPAGRGAVPAVTFIAYQDTPITATADAAISTSPASPPMARLARPSQKAAKATWMNPPTRRTRLDHATAGVRSAALRAPCFGVTVINGTGINGVVMALAASGWMVMACPAGSGTRR